MRRIVTGALLAIFTLQVCGITSASPALPAVPSSADANRVAPPLAAQLYDRLAGTYIFALLTGTANMYQAIHAQAPSFKPGKANRITEAQTRVPHGVQPRYVGKGGRVLFPDMAQALTNKTHSDRLAMRASHSKSKTTRSVNPARAGVTGVPVASRNAITNKPYITVNPSSVSGNVGGQAAIATEQYIWDVGSGGYIDNGPCTPASSSSSNAAVAAVSGNTITFVGQGTATVTFTCAGSAIVHVTVANSTPTPAPTPTPCPSGWSGLPPSCVSPTPTPVPTAAPTPAPTPLGVSTTGINPYWSYQEGGIPGIGRWMDNVGTGNLLVQADDIDLPERGIDLAFRRTYNSQSQHDVINTDNSVQSNYGNGWTNTFDAHLAYNAATNTMVVYDIDGARYDYTSDGNGNWLSASPGQHATLKPGGGCGYHWEKKNGTRYVFYAPYTDGGCMPLSSLGLAGRLYSIESRNHNNNIQFQYSWLDESGQVNSSSSNNLSQIVALHSDGESVTLTFADFGTHRLLWKIARPDGALVTYGYDTAGNLTDVWEIGNDRAVNATPIHYELGYSGTTLSYADSPNWVAGQSDRPGSYLTFSYDSVAPQKVTDVLYHGVVNPAPNDGSGTVAALDPSYGTAAMDYREDQFTYTSGQTAFADRDGHAAIYHYDNRFRVTESDVSNGQVNLITTQSWDDNNNLVSTVDPRGNATGNLSAYTTDYEYDANGNTIAVARPAITVTVGSGQSTFRPTSLYSYDPSNNNLMAYCDPVESHALSDDWGATGVPDASKCSSSQPGATRYTYDTSDTQVEPFGRLTDAYSPCYGGSCGANNPGKHEKYVYDTAGQGGDFGLPTTVSFDCSAVQYDGSQDCSTQTFGYAPNGTLTSYGTGSGTWTLGYDSNNRLTSMEDPDQVITRKCYFSDGSVQATQTAAQYALDGSVTCGSHSVAYTYDLDGNKLTENHHYNNVAGTTTYWYDGDDRVVEVGEPKDSANDYYTSPWLTRNIYDVSQGQSRSIGSIAGVKAYGNLYKMQEWVLGHWVDVKGQGFDALDRSVNKYSLWTGHYPTMVDTSYTYDSSNDLMGLLAKRTDPLSQVTNYSYDAGGNLKETSYENDGGVTPSETYTIDADGRDTSITSSVFGTESTQYDADGSVDKRVEAAGGGFTSNATYQYFYDSSGKRARLSATASALVNGPLALQYAYRADGLRTGLQMTYGSTTASIAWNRQASGRVASISDSSGQPTRKFTYENGQLLEDQMPSADISGMQYDAEGELTAYTYPLGTTAIGYTTRGELTSQTYSNQQYNACNPTPDGAATYSPLRQKGANGTMIPITQECLQQGATFGNDAAINWDDYTGGNLGPSLPTADQVTVKYDQSNRQTTAEDDWDWTMCGGDGTCNTRYGYSYLNRTYDAENHLLTEVDSGDQWNTNDFPLTGCVDPWHNLSSQPNFDTVNVGYSWGPNGHPALMDGLSVHWDGDSPLFVTSSSGGLQEIKVEGLALGGTSWKFLDRNQSGYVVASHWTGGHSDWTPNSASHQTCGGAALAGTFLIEPGPDGIGDGYNILQGVRNYDPQLGQWSSPDAYAGKAADPMSQKAFMWNRGNPYKYQDPSGYATVLLYDTKFGVVLGHAAVFITDDGIHGLYLCECGVTRGNPLHGPTAVTGRMTTIDQLMRGTKGSEMARYDRATIFWTSDDQQANFVRDFEKETGDTYDAVSHNCVQVCLKSFHDIGVDTGTSGPGNTVPNVTQLQTHSIPLDQVPLIIQPGNR